MLSTPIVIGISVCISGESFLISFLRIREKTIWNI